MNNMNITSDLIDSRYCIIRNIGSGAMGNVFLVHDEKLDKLWAAKLVRNITSNELTALKSVSHPAFPRLVDTVMENDYIWLIMDYIEGRSLTDYMAQARCGKSPVMSISLQLARAMHYLHTLTPAMLYLDCKPENIIIDSNGMLHLIDLGSIYLVNLSNPGRISGTAGYASPEQRLGIAADVRSDIYAYGMTLKAIIPGPYTPDILLSIIRKCTYKHPEKRFQSMTEIIECIIRPSRFTKLSMTDFINQTALICISLSFTLFTIISLHTYSITNNTIYLLLSLFLFAGMLLLSEKYRKSHIFSHWSCQKDIYLSRGLRSLPIIILCTLSLSFLFNMSVRAASGHADSSYRITLYTSKNEKILYRGQKFTINPDGSLTLSIPLSSLTPDSIPTRLELSEIAE